MRNSIRLVCHLAVAVWIGAFLAWRAIGLPAAVPVDAPQEAQLRPLPEPPEPAASAPEPEASAPAEAPPTPEVIDVGRAALDRGDALLSDGGSFPVLSFRYDGLGSFRGYARAMERLGARFVVVRQREIVAQVNPDSGALAEPDVDSRFSPRARNYSDEPALSGLARDVRSRFGGEAEVMMLVPRRLDAGLFGGIAEGLAGRGLSHRSLREIQGGYGLGPAGGLGVRIDSAEARDGSRLALGWWIDLETLAGGPSA